MSVEFTVNQAAWREQFKNQSTIALEVSREVIIRTVYQLYKRIVDYTPVGDPSLWKYPAPKDYVPGTLKSSWFVALDDNTVNADSSLNKSLVNSKWSVISIYNNQPYALRVENGWSTQQAPYGMLRRAILDFPSLINSESRQ